jgi:GNAT superfamily N-acetyltransferase
MPRPEIRPFSDEFVAPAGALLAERQRRHRDAEPLLSVEFDFAAEVEAAWRRDGASGAVALAADGLAGFLLGAPRHGSWGPNVWVEAAGHAVAEQELVRDLYGAAAARWAEEGRTAHYALVPATDASLVDAWFRSGFGQQHVHGICEVPGDDVSPRPGVQVRPAATGDLDSLVKLGLVLSELQRGSPTFAGLPRPDLEAERTEWAEELDDDTVGTLVAEVDGRVAGVATVAPVECSGAHSGVARPQGAAILGFAATFEDVRGRGAGLALTDAVFAWAREHGYGTIVVDWRETNLSSSRFWPRRGFRPAFLRLHRSIA